MGAWGSLGRFGLSTGKLAGRGAWGITKALGRELGNETVNRSTLGTRNIALSRNTRSNIQQTEDPLSDIFQATIRVDQDLQENNQLLSQLVAVVKESKGSTNKQTGNSLLDMLGGGGGGLPNIIRNKAKPQKNNPKNGPWGKRPSKIPGLNFLKGARAIPGLQQILGAGMAGYNLYQGDYTGAALSAGSMIPGPIGWGFLGAEVGRELGAFDNIPGLADKSTVTTQQKHEMTTGWQNPGATVQKQNEELRKKWKQEQSYKEIDGSLRAPQQLADGMSPISFSGKQDTGRNLKIIVNDLIFKADTITFDIGPGKSSSGTAHGSGGFGSSGSFQRVAYQQSSPIFGQQNRASSIAGTSLPNAESILPNSIGDNYSGSLNIPGISNGPGIGTGYTGGGRAGGGGSYSPTYPAGDSETATEQAQRGSTTFGPSVSSFSKTLGSGPEFKAGSATVNSNLSRDISAENSPYRAQQRAKYFEQIEKDPHLKKEVSLMLMHEGRAGKDRTKVLESLMNRAHFEQGDRPDAIKRALHNGFYANIKSGRSDNEIAAGRDERNNPAVVEAYNNVKGGSDLIKGKSNQGLSTDRSTPWAPGEKEARRYEQDPDKRGNVYYDKEGIKSSRIKEDLDKQVEFDKEYRAKQAVNGGTVSPGGIKDVTTKRVDNSVLPTTMFSGPTKLEKTGGVGAPTGAAESEKYGYKKGTVTVDGSRPFAWGSGAPGVYSVSAGSYKLNVPPAQLGTGSSWGDVGPIGQNYPASMGGPALATINEPGRSSGGVQSHAGIQIHGSSSSEIDRLYTQGCFAVSKKDFPEFKKSLLAAAAKHGSLTLDIGKDGVARIGGARVDAPTTIAKVAQSKDPNLSSELTSSKPISGSTINAANVAPVKTEQQIVEALKPKQTGNLGFKPGTDANSPTGFNKRGEPIFASKPVDNEPPAVPEPAIPQSKNATAEPVPATTSRSAPPEPETSTKEPMPPVEPERKTDNPATTSDTSLSDGP